MSVQATILDKTSNIQEYICKMAPKDKLLRECLKQQQRGADDQAEEVPWHSKVLHGMYHRQIVEVADIGKSYQWLEKAGLTDSTDALILAAHEQALGTRWIEAGVYHTRQDPRCRLCKEASETVQHIVAGCKMQAGTANTERLTKWLASCTGTSVPTMDQTLPVPDGKLLRRLWINTV